MAVRLHEEALAHAKKLIRDGKVEVDEQDDWSEHQPGTDDENEYIDEQGMEAYGKWYLGIDTDDKPDNKGYYKFPYGDFKKVHRGGVIALKQRAAQYDYEDIRDAADDLLERIDSDSDLD